MTEKPSPLSQCLSDYYDLTDEHCRRLLELERDAELGRLVRMMPPGHFLGREYAEVIHDVKDDWVYIRMRYKKQDYLEIGFGYCQEKALGAEQ